MKQCYVTLGECDETNSEVQRLFNNGCADHCNYYEYFDECVEIFELKPCQDTERFGHLFLAGCAGSCNYEEYEFECVKLQGSMCEAYPEYFDQTSCNCNYFNYEDQCNSLLKECDELV